MSLDGYDHYTMTKSLGIFLTSFVDVLKEKNLIGYCLPEIGGTVNGFVAGLYLYSSCTYTGWRKIGTLMDWLGMLLESFLIFISQQMMMHALAMGEEKFRIFNLGAPQIDEIKNRGL